LTSLPNAIILKIVRSIIVLEFTRKTRDHMRKLGIVAMFQLGLPAAWPMNEDGLIMHGEAKGVMAIDCYLMKGGYFLFSIREKGDSY
jgi:hypothetical protein